jgi:hypothetical protein
MRSHARAAIASGAADLVRRHDRGSDGSVKLTARNTVRGGAVGGGGGPKKDRSGFARSPWLAGAVCRQTAGRPPRVGAGLEAARSSSLDRTPLALRTRAAAQIRPRPPSRCARSSRLRRGCLWRPSRRQWAHALRAAAHQSGRTHEVGERSAAAGPLPAVFVHAPFPVALAISVKQRANAC